MLKLFKTKSINMIIENQYMSKISNHKTTTVGLMWQKFIGNITEAQYNKFSEEITITIISDDISNEETLTTKCGLKHLHGNLFTTYDGYVVDLIDDQTTFNRSELPHIRNFML